MTNLLRFAIERTYRGVTPSKAITAPAPERVVVSMLTESERLAQFEQSAATRDGEVAPYRKAA